MELRVHAVARHELIVRPTLHDLPVLQDEDLIRGAHGRDAMRHDDRRSLAHHRGQSREDLLFRVRIHGRERIVQDQDLRVDRQRARDGGTLLLPAGERDAALADHGVVSFRKIAEIRVEPRHLGRVFDARQLRVRASSAKPDVLRDGGAEEKGLLRDEADGAAQRRERKMADVDAIDEDGPARRLVQARQQIQQRGLP